MKRARCWKRPLLAAGCSNAGAGKGACVGVCGLCRRYPGGVERATTVREFAARCSLLAVGCCQFARSRPVPIASECGNGSEEGCVQKGPNCRLCTLLMSMLMVSSVCRSSWVATLTPGLRLAGRRGSTTNGRAGSAAEHERPPPPFLFPFIPWGPYHHTIMSNDQHLTTR